MATKTQTTAASQQRTIDALKARITFLHGEHEKTHRELEAALARNVRAHETIRVLSGLLTEADAEVTTRRQLNGEIPF
jgi:tRNA C32,U32 (ribose-2'-O)-methylase TrmJ